MFTLFVSTDCGVSYHQEEEKETLEELRPLMKQFDDEMLRWYLEKDGEAYYEEICLIHGSLTNTMSKVRGL